SGILNWPCFRTLMNLLCLSVTLNIKFTSSVRLRKVSTDIVSSTAVTPPVVIAVDVDVWDAPVVVGGGAGGACDHASARVLGSASNAAMIRRKDIGRTLMFIIVWETDPQFSISRRNSVNSADNGC